jgi:hypothetical protein
MWMTRRRLTNRLAHLLVLYGMRAKRMPMWKRAAIGAAMLGALASARVMATPSIHRPVVQFIHFYQESEDDAQTRDMSLWDRILYSLLMTTTAAS